MDLWAYQNGVGIGFSRPGKPTDNAYIETFSGTLRAECLDTHWFGTLAEARGRIEAWRREYNESRPHRFLNRRHHVTVSAPPVGLSGRHACRGKRETKQHFLPTYQTHVSRRIKPGLMWARVRNFPLSRGQHFW
jgi:hypothetical protein